MGIWGGHGSAHKGWEKKAKGLSHGMREDLIQISRAPRQVEVCTEVTLRQGTSASSETLEVGMNGLHAACGFTTALGF